jgi:hypothetical protein
LPISWPAGCHGDALIGKGDAPLLACEGEYTIS